MAWWGATIDTNGWAIDKISTMDVATLVHIGGTYGLPQPRMRPYFKLPEPRILRNSGQNSFGAAEHFNCLKSWNLVGCARRVV